MMITQKTENFISEIQINIYSEQLEEEYGGAAGVVSRDDPLYSLGKPLQLYFPNYEDFLEFYNYIIKLKIGIDEYRKENNITD